MNGTGYFSERRLKYAATLNDESLSESTDPDLVLTYIDIGNVDSQGRIHDIVSHRFEAAPSRARRIVRNGDVIISTVRTYLQAIAAIELSPENLIVSTGFAVVRPSRLLNNNYLKYALRSGSFLSEIEGRSIGVSYPAINPSELGSIKIHLPTLEIQPVIADYLDCETGRIDGLIAEKDRMLALLDERRAALISQAVTRGVNSDISLKSSSHEWLGDLPAHWEVRRLKQLAEVRGGLTLGKQYGQAALLNYPYLRVANVQDGFLDLEDVLTVDASPADATSNLLRYGDVLMNEGGDIDKLGRGCVWRDEIKPCLHQNHVFAVRPHSVQSEWLALWTSSPEAKRYFESRAKRSTNLASISSWNIKELVVPIPPAAEQSAIQLQLSASLQRIESIRKELIESVRLLRARRAALISAAVTGQIPLEQMQS